MSLVDVKTYWNIFDKKQTDNMMENDGNDGNIGCGAFVDLQKAFDIVDHQILLAKFNHYGICGVSNDWFKS